MMLALLSVCHATEPLWNTSYIAQAWRPGAKVGLDLPLKEVEKTRRRSGEALTRQLRIEPAFTFWYHRHNHIPLTLGAQLFTRRARPGGGVRELFIGQGITYAINDGTTYVFDDSGELVGSALAGHLMSATTLGFGLGRSRDDLDWHVRPSMTLWAPYNSGFAPVFTVEIGVRRAWFTGER